MRDVTGPAVRGRARRLLALVVVVFVGLSPLGGGDATPPALAQQVEQTAASPYRPPAPPLLEAPPAGWPSPSEPPAAAYLLMDAASGQILFERAADEPRAVASTVKVLTALTVVARAELDEQVVVGEEVARVTGSGAGLVPGERWSVAELLDAMIARSGNDAAEALAVHVGGTREGFLELMRADAAALGLGQPPLVSPSGLDDANRLSAHQLATLTRAALADPRLRAFFARPRVTLPSVGEVASRNELLMRYPDATGVKTGFTEAAGYSLIGSAQRDGRELIAVVLDAGGDPARFDGAARLLDLGFEDYRARVLQTSFGFAVAGGEVVLRAPDTRVTVPVDALVELRPPIGPRPPEGDVEVDLEVDGEVLATVTGLREQQVGPAADSDDEAIGRAIVDGAYAALRAAASTGSLR